MLPLLIITLCFNLISSERESGVWAVIASQPYAASTIIFLKFAVRFLAVLLLSLALLLLAVVLLDLPINQDFLQIFLLLVAYELFWFAVVFFVSYFKNSSNFNAVVLLGIWLSLVILLPALANVLINRYLPIPEAFSIAVTQREAYHEKWDEPKAVVMDPFYEAYPEYKKYPVPEDQYSDGWYYAMMFAADHAVAKDSKKLFEKLEKRQDISRVLGYFLPSLLLQNTFNHIAETDLEDHLRYLNSVKRYHKQLSEFFYPYLFKQSAIEEVPWEKLPQYKSYSED